MSNFIKSTSEKSDKWTSARRVNFFLSTAENEFIGFKQAKQNSNFLVHLRETIF